jgi:hypothetical protein
MVSNPTLVSYARRLARWLALEWQHLLSVVALVGLFLFVQRFVDGLDTGGDAVSKWQFVRQWSWANELRHAKWDHHMTRMGVHVVTWLVQKICDAGWRSYYVGPLFMGAVQVPLVYALARRLSGGLGAFLAALVVIYLPAVHTSVSQLLPDEYVGTYALLATYLLARCSEAKEAHKLPLLLGSALAAFVGYLAKETCFFFYPGFLLAVWLLRRRLRDALLFAGVLLLGLVLETLAYWLFTDYSSRLAIVRSVHFSGAKAEAPTEVTLRGFFGVFARLDLPWRYLLVAAAIGVVGLILVRYRARTLGRASAAIGLSHVALLSLSSQLWQNPLPRYMDPVIGFAGIYAAFAVATTVRALAGLPGRLPALQAIWSRLRWLLAKPSVTAVASVTVTLILAWHTQRDQAEEPPFDGKAQGQLMAHLATRTYDRNLPLAQRSTRAKTLVAFYNVYLDPGRLVRGGILPSFDKARRRARSYTYLVKDPSVYSSKIFNALLAEGCVLEVRNIKRLPRIPSCADATRHSQLPARCDTLLAELTSRARQSRRQGAR